MTAKRLLMPLIVMGIILTVGNIAFAQTNVTCGLSTPLGATPTAASTGHTEPIGTGTPTNAAGAGLGLVPPVPGGGVLRVTCSNSGTSGAGFADPGVVILTVQLSAPITNSTAHPGVAPIRLANAPYIAPSVATFAGDDFVVHPGGAVAITAPMNVLISTINASAGQIIIVMGNNPVFASSATSPTQGVVYDNAPVPVAPAVVVPRVSQFDILGVLTSANGKTGAVTASLVATGGVSITPGSGSINVITAVTPGLKDPTLAATIPTVVSTALGGVTSGAAVLNSAGTAIKGNFTLRIEEGYADMFRESGQVNGGGVFPSSPSSDTQVNVQLNNVPTGLNISSCNAVLTNLAGDTVSTTAAAVVNSTNITSASPILTVNFSPIGGGFGPDVTAIEVLWVGCTSVSSGTATLPLPSLSVTAQVYLGVSGIALSTGTTPAPLTGVTSGQIPRYQLLLQPATGVTVVVFPPSNTTMLIPFAATSPGYNTGIAVSNTSMDPFTPAGGGAAASEGTLVFTMYKSDGTSKSYTTTTGSPGSGYTGAGVVKAGQTYAVQLSDLLSAAAFGSTFNGYIFITANFTFAHGAATIYVTTDGSAALSSPVLILPAVSTAAPRPSPEALNN